MQYFTNDIWKDGLYSTHQKCLSAINRIGLQIVEVDGKKSINKVDYITLLQDRASTVKTEVGRKEVRRRLKEVGITALNEKKDSKVRKPIKSPERTKKIVKENVWHQRWSNSTISLLSTVAQFFTAKPIVFVTLMLALSIQVHHLATLVNRVGSNDGIILGYLFGSVSEITALLLTLHNASKRTLIIFAFVQFWVNILYYCELPLLVTKITLSGLIAYVVFSYSELYTSSISKDNGTK